MKRAESADVAALFERLAARAVACAELQDELLEGITKHREARTGRGFRYTRRQQEQLKEFDSDAERAMQDEQRLIATMDDASLLASTVGAEQASLELDEAMYPTMPEEDKAAASRVVSHRKETIRLLMEFIECSPLKDRVLAYLRRTTRTRPS